MKLNVGRHTGEFSSNIEGASSEAEASPILGQTFETVETVHLAAADPTSDEAHRAACEHAELQIMSVDLCRSQSIGCQLTLVLEAKRIRHRLLDIVDRAVERPDRTFPHGMNKADVGELVKCAYNLVEDVLHIEIGYEHG